MDATHMQNAMIAQPQVQNLHRRVFGGFLMRRAFELAFSNAYLFAGRKPHFVEVDQVRFMSPVDVGDLLVLNSRILYTSTTTEENSDVPQQQQHALHTSTTAPSVSHVHVEVEAWVTEPEKVSARLSNQFYFTFECGSDETETTTDSQQQQQRPIRRVLPSNWEQAQRMAWRMKADHEQKNLL
jgi:acyl-coenzyme A thioesterase 9